MYVFIILFSDMQSYKIILNTASILLQNWPIQLQRLSLTGERRFLQILHTEQIRAYAVSSEENKNGQMGHSSILDEKPSQADCLHEPLQFFHQLWKAPLLHYLHG